MGRFCYCSPILPGKTEAIREHWKDKTEPEEDGGSFWRHLKMTGFECWLQGDFMIHCLEGESLQQIFKGLREQIALENRMALNLQKFYLNVLGKETWRGKRSLAS
jgi:hypothetical protein